MQDEDKIKFFEKVDKLKYLRFTIIRILFT